MTIDVPDLTDSGKITLQELVKIVNRLVDNYPLSSIVEFDAGYNNISCTITPPPVQDTP